MEINHFYAADDFTGEQCVLLSDHVASHAYDEAKEREPFAEAMVELGRCNHVNAVLSDDDFYHFKSDWEVWKACAKSRARSAE